MRARTSYPSGTFAELTLYGDENRRSKGYGVLKRGDGLVSKLWQFLLWQTIAFSMHSRANFAQRFIAELKI
jgi:hypothetical protein